MDVRPICRWLFLAGLGGLIGGGCGSTTETHPASGPSVALERGGVAVVADPHGGLDDDDYIMNCLRRALRGERPQLTVVSGHDFRDAIFPWFEPDQTPTDEGQFGSVLGRPAVRERVHQLGVRYLVLVGGNTWEGNRQGGIFCGAGSRGGGCLGFATYERHSSAEAQVWDLGEARAITTLGAETSGRAVIPAFVLPIPFIPATQSAACDSTARQLLDLLGG